METEHWVWLSRDSRLNEEEECVRQPVSPDRYELFLCLHILLTDAPSGE
jgi:hypothetical protein